MSAKRGRFLRGKNTVTETQDKILERFLPYA
jgi:ribosomal protein L35